jgi:hypothetical protein
MVAAFVLASVLLITWDIGDHMKHIILHLAAGEQPDLPEVLTALLVAGAAGASVLWLRHENRIFRKYVM